MAKITETQEVKKFKDEETMCTQEVHLDSDDLGGWMIITHDGYEIPLSVSNWKSLIQLGNSVLEKAKTHDLQS